MRWSTELYKHGQHHHVRVAKLLLEHVEWKHRDDLMLVVTENKSLRIQTLEKYVRDCVATGLAPQGTIHSASKLLMSGSSLHVSVPPVIVTAVEWKPREALILEDRPGQALRVQTLERYLKEQADVVDLARQARPAELHA